MALTTAVKGRETCYEAGRNRSAKTESENGPATIGSQVEIAGEDGKVGARVHYMYTFVGYPHGPI